MLRYGFERDGLTRILGIADAENFASRRVLEKIGMTFEGYVVTEGREEARYAIRPEGFQRVVPTTRGWRPVGGGGLALAPDPADPDRHVHQLREAAGQRFE